MRFITPFHGFCMALADSVPGVSGGTVAFILGSYDRFINALHDLFGRDNTRRKEALGYLLKLGIGWAAGMALCVSLLAGLFSVHIYFMSSLFLSGAVAITAMVLPGISGSSILLIAGVYLPVIQAIRQLLRLDLHVLPGLMALGFGVIAGVALSIKAIRAALRKYRPAMMWFILGLMLGSLYAIVNGPASLQVPQKPLCAATVQPLALLLGVGLLVGLEFLRRRMDRSVTTA